MKKLNLQSDLQNLKQLFSDLNIKTDCVGFYNDDNFIAAEKLCSSFLENYAAYVQYKGYSDNYLKKASQEIPFIATIIHQELVKGGRLGACVDASAVLSQILEREGFWNHIIKGSLTIKFPREATLEDRYFWSIDFGQFVAGHAWVFAPPFNVIDITIQQQPFSKGEEKWLPPYILQSEYSSCNIEEQDIISADARKVMKIQGIKGKLLPYIKDNWEKFISVFKPNLIKINGTGLKYIPTAITAPDEPLERAFALEFSGRKGYELYHDLIIPKLKEFRDNQK